MYSGYLTRCTSTPVNNSVKDVLTKRSLCVIAAGNSTPCAPSTETYTDARSRTRSYINPLRNYGCNIRRISSTSACAQTTPTWSEHRRISENFQQQRRQQHGGRVTGRVKHQRRCFASHTAKSTTAAWNGAVIVTQDASITKQEEVLAKIEPHQDTTRPSRLNAVFLLSAAFGPWLNENSQFLSKALARLYAHNASPSLVSVKILAAVVDRIPAPSPVWDTNISSWSDVTKRRSALPLTGESGFEGLAYCTFEESDSTKIQELNFSSFASSVHVGLTQHGTVSFVQKSSSDTDAAVSAVTLPLARTIFSTGRPYTMHLSEWTRNSSTGAFEKSDHEAATHQVVHLPAQPLSPNSGSAMHHLPYTVCAPIIALTPHQQIERSMGNIVRRLKRADGSVFPASEELEAAVAKYFDENDVPPQPVEAWALIISQAVLSKYPSLLDKLGEDQLPLFRPGTLSTSLGNFPRYFSALNALLECGATLHRVVSGGGGWGKKAGLLSLDPNTTYGPSPLVSMLSSSDPASVTAGKENKGIPSFEEMFGSIATSGDYIKFFVTPVSFAETTSNFEQDLSRTESRLQSLDFGVLPKTIDDNDHPHNVPDPELQSGSSRELDITSSQAKSAGASKGQTTAGKLITVFKTHFGALSEGGMSIERIAQSNSASKSSPSLSPFKTKVDVPFARFSCSSITSQ